METRYAIGNREKPSEFNDFGGNFGANPVAVAASTHFPLRNRISLQVEGSVNIDRLRRRSSLVEAFNNGIVFSYPSEDEEREQEERLKMLRRRAVVTPRAVKFPPQDELPRALLRSYTQQSRERRARSQPLHQNLSVREDSDDDFNSVRHISRADRFSVNSEAGHSSQDSGIRCSTHSNSSAATTTCSTISSVDERVGMPVAEALFDHVAILSDELPFSAGDLITVIDSTADPLWYGSCREANGWFPASYVRLRVSADHRPNPTTSTNNDYPPGMRHLRRKVVEELMGTERDYVTLLHNLVEGFIEQCRRRTEMFTEERIRRIFGNIEQIALLHSKLLRELEIAFDQKYPENSSVANAFLRNSQSFSVYTEYCNNRPVSCTELAQLSAKPQYHHFFEACRLLKGMAKLSLEGFLLTPVQRICRYPMQLCELLKATPLNHPDRYPLEQAQRTMRATAAHINDAKRRIDSIQKIILWQRDVHGFRGPDLTDNNHRILISSEMYCRAIMKTSVQWSKTVYVFVFDSSIVLCKKDVLRKNALVFKERMSLQCTNVVDIADGKELLTGAHLRNSFKLSGNSREYIFTATSDAIKRQWLDTLRARPIRPNPPTNAEKRLALLTLNG